ncbi:hypothetical protein LET06_18870 [Pectobacterium versatile]|nr:hypothetical protein [Pectobacterium versatile]MCA5932995.1 hypothetical protein [Pectobacterium versatile]MCA5949182.1 hypothetical protein [Pectobacterium versatile]MCA5953598.1 hypothetical protein [Pectobacterium versatile]UCP84026.1 hypothetical protein LGL96_11255 [Pectobacterium versatile]
MSVRSEIIDGRQVSGVTYGLIYTEVLGWIDLGHAKGDDIKDIIQQMYVGEDTEDGMPYYDV